MYTHTSMNLFFRKVLRVVLISFVLLVSLLVGWLGYVSSLTIQNDRACGGQITMIKESNYTQNDEELQRVLDNYSAKKAGVGLQATVIFPDGTVWSGVSGCANHKKKCRLTLDHHLYIGSMTKLYTATLVMEQVENGRIALDNLLSKWIDLPYAKKITVRMLLNHTSGIPSYTEDLWFLVRWFGFPKKRWRPDELLAGTRNKGLKFEPGSRHEYSNFNYLLLGVILENVTDKAYGVLLRELTVNKLGLEDTYYLNYFKNILIANGYDETLLHLGRRNLAGFRWSLETGAFSAGGILSTSEDVASFVHSLFLERILDSSTLAQMKAFIKAPDEDVPLQKGYGLGIRNLIVGGENLIGHTGTIPGYSGIAMHNDEKHYTIVILSNLSVIEQTQLFEEVQHIVIDRLQMRKQQNIHPHQHKMINKNVYPHLYNSGHAVRYCSPKPFRTSNSRISLYDILPKPKEVNLYV